MADILRSIGIIARSLAAISNIEFKNLQLDKDQYLYVSRIYEHPGIINDELAEMVIQDRTTVAKSIRKLVDIDFVEKRLDATNKKVRRLYLTEKGIEVYHFLHREETYSYEQAIQGLTNEEISTLESLLKIMEKNIESEWQAVKGGIQRPY